MSESAISGHIEMYLKYSLSIRECELLLTVKFPRLYCLVFDRYFFFLLSNGNSSVMHFIQICAFSLMSIVRYFFP